ncbi:MAG: TetR/AcrR family transcriptional regulator [Flavobacteriales bacterium]|nr:TetR/AcrR family transcriptional regulator [Flavobacteriales bacterium]
MTEKQQNIFNAALELFSSEGVDATSTSKIAKRAGVSEGLIFRHFKNKEGLLQAILEEGLNKGEAYFREIASEENPKKRILSALQLPFSISPNEYPFWRLFYTLKWQRCNIETEGVMDFRTSLSDAFTQLKYTNPEAEARLVEAIIDGVATEILIKNLDPQPLLQCLLDKYKLK